MKLPEPVPDDSAEGSKRQGRLRKPSCIDTTRIAKRVGNHVLVDRHVTLTHVQINRWVRRWKIRGEALIEVSIL